MASGMFGRKYRSFSFNIEKGNITMFWAFMLDLCGDHDDLRPNFFFFFFNIESPQVCLRFGESLMKYGSGKEYPWLEGYPKLYNCSTFAFKPSKVAV